MWLQTIDTVYILLYEGARQLIIASGFLQGGQTLKSDGATAVIEIGRDGVSLSAFAD